MTRREQGRPGGRGRRGTGGDPETTYDLAGPLLIGGVVGGDEGETTLAALEGSLTRGNVGVALDRGEWGEGERVGGWEGGREGGWESGRVGWWEGGRDRQVKEGEHTAP